MTKTYCPELYVGFSQREQLLAFAVPNDNQNRKSTVDRWRNKDIEAKIIPNTPVPGIRFAGKETRHTTSREWFRVIDPRGFELEISMENCLNLMDECVIEYGVIQNRCVWLFTNGKVYLATEDNLEYLALVKRHEEKASGVKMKLEVGKVYKFGGCHGYTYQGRMYYTQVDRRDYVYSIRSELNHIFYKKEERWESQQERKSMPANIFEVEGDPVMRQYGEFFDPATKVSTKKITIYPASYIKEVLQERHFSYGFNPASARVYQKDGKMGVTVRMERDRQYYYSYHGYSSIKDETREFVIGDFDLTYEDFGKLCAGIFPNTVIS